VVAAKKKSTKKAVKPVAKKQVKKVTKKVTKKVSKKPAVKKLVKKSPKKMAKILPAPKKTKVIVAVAPVVDSSGVVTISPVHDDVLNS